MPLRRVIVFSLFFPLFFISGCASQTAPENLFLDKQINKEEIGDSNSMVKKVVLIIAFKDFKDEEYFVTKEVLEKRGIEVETASNQRGIAEGVEGGEVVINKTLNDLEIDDYDGVVFIGGPGCLSHLDNEVAYGVVREAVNKGKILGAICISPVILAKAGALKGKKATVWSDGFNKEPIEILQENEAVYQDKSVVADGQIVTANGPAAAEEFGRILVKLLTKEPK